MKKIAEYVREGGSVEFFEDFNKNIFMAQPHGDINPVLLKEDLSHARAFSKKVNQPWFYVTNTEDVRLVNPFNLLYLKEVKKLQKLQAIVVYAPNFLHRMLLRAAWLIVQPDKVFSRKEDFVKFLGMAQSARA